MGNSNMISRIGYSNRKSQLGRKIRSEGYLLSPLYLNRSLTKKLMFQTILLTVPSKSIGTVEIFLVFHFEPKAEAISAQSWYCTLKYLSVGSEYATCRHEVPACHNHTPHVCTIRWNGGCKSLGTLRFFHQNSRITSRNAFRLNK
jgi:hypothetical protein